jgi:hypothetical protein
MLGLRALKYWQAHDLAHESQKYHFLFSSRQENVKADEPALFGRELGNM